MGGHIYVGQIGVADKVLALLGKRRAVQIPTTTIRAEHYRARRESFLSALLRSGSRPLPKGWSYFDEQTLAEMARSRDALKMASRRQP